VAGKVVAGKVVACKVARLRRWLPAPSAACGERSECWWHSTSRVRARVAGKVVAGKVVAGKVVAGKVVAGKVVAGKVVAGKARGGALGCG
jgi:hypothetical protein